MRKNKNKKKSQLGQVTVEYILLAVVLITLFQLASKTLKDNDYLANFTDTPYAIFVHLAEHGNWEPDKNESRNLHPNNHELHYTPFGEGP